MPPLVRKEGYWVLVVAGVVVVAGVFVVVVVRRSPIALMKRWNADGWALVTTAAPFAFTTRTDESDPAVGVARVELAVVAVVLVGTLAAGVAATAFVIGVAIAFEIGEVVFVTPAVVAAGAATGVPVATLNPALPSAPLTIAGVGAELIDEFTVTCGFAYADGGMN